jgi:SPP1 gp7 family putative phage head morphogenesis protein
VDNPNAVYRIDQVTRDGVKSLVTQAIDGGWSNDRLATALKDSYAFSAARAELIAVTETAFADVQGNMIAYEESGVVVGKRWIVGSAEKLCEICADNAAQGVIPFDKQFASGRLAPPAHPRCRCDVLPVTKKESRK